MSDSHGSTPAAWTAVIVMIVGCLVAALGVVLLDWWLIAIGFAIVALGAVAGKVMQMMGFGQTASYRQPAAEAAVEGEHAPDVDREQLR